MTSATHTSSFRDKATLFVLSGFDTRLQGTPRISIVEGAHFVPLKRLDKAHFSAAWLEQATTWHLFRSIVATGASVFLWPVVVAQHDIDLDQRRVLLVTYLNIAHRLGKENARFLAPFAAHHHLLLPSLSVGVTRDGHVRWYVTQQIRRSTILPSIQRLTS